MSKKLAAKVEAAAAKLVHPKSSSKPATNIDTSNIGQIEKPKDGQRTPADEAIFFFESAPAADAKPIQVWELQLEEDGAPSKDKAVSPLFPSATARLLSHTDRACLVHPFASSDGTVRPPCFDRGWFASDQEWRVQDQLSAGRRSL